jgi:AcrR family transcriptional regulator
MTEDSLSKGERTSRVLVDAAYNLMVTQGYAATSMRQIANKAGLSLGGIYNHFSSKEDVFVAVVGERHPFIQIVPLINSAEGATIEVFARNAAHTLIAELGHHPEFLNLLLIEIVEFKGKHVPLIFDKLFPMLVPLAQRLSSMEGNIREIPQFVLVRAFLGMFFSFFITETLLSRTTLMETQTDALDHFVDIFLHGILVDKETNHV